MSASNEDDLEELQGLRNGKKPQIVSGLNRPLEPTPLGEQTRAVRRQILMVVLGNIGVLSGGMSLGLPTVTMRELVDLSLPVHLNTSQATWFASVNTLSLPLGGLLSGVILDKFGRKNSLYAVNILNLIAWALMALAIQDDPQIVFIQLMVSRFIIGVAMGLASAPVGVYGAEISVPKMRGRLILGTSIAIAAGITFIYLLGYLIQDDYHLIALICCIYQIIALLCVIPMPESFSWLLAKGRIAEAKKSLNYFRGLSKSSEIMHPEVVAEFNVLQKSLQSGVGERKHSFVKMCRLPEVYKPLLILMGLFAFQQLSGIFVVIVYAVQISLEAGVSIDPFICAVLIGVSRLVTTCPMGGILEFWGRRRAGIISTIGMGLSMFLLAAYKWWEFLQNIPYLPLIAILAFIILSTLGLYTLPFFMISELFPQKVRGPASGLTVAVGMFVAFICIKTFPSLKESIGYENCFVIYGIMSIAATLFIYLVLPETRGRTLLQIEEEFRTGKKSKTPPPPVEMQEIFIK